MMGKTKQQLRETAIGIRDAISDVEHKQWSQHICEQIRCDRDFIVAQTIAIFWPIGSEINILPLLEQSDKRFVFPRVAGKEMVFAKLDAEHSIGYFGQREPHQEQEAIIPDMLIVPLLAFTEDGYRLGYGGGYYDRYLAAVKRPAVGVAFEVQKVDKLPVEAFDIPLKRIVTEQAVYKR